ncbi:MAG: thioredoxin family protein [Ferrovibrio sp.]|uniref:DUF899 domain-containing protein n=1 Tax=Ferrovibrio sp. TaxID=1917215 RepID=UPI00260AE10E|nr:thioredoxin family protein [Ferrovibrio sp.]MCW0236261.1 thioredoxin family protein [Ferrovibrio sp.]
MTQHKIVSREDWLAARRQHLAREKDVTHAMDRLHEERRALPWVKVDKGYSFDTTEGGKSLSDLFGRNSQLIVYHFMFGPDWEEGCPGCSFLADHIDGANLHLRHHDVSVVVVSRGPLDRLQAYRRRMDWKFDWVSSAPSDFNYDYHVSFTPEDLADGRVFYNFEETPEGNDELPGISVFYRDKKGGIFHTYSSYGRGGDILIGAHNYLDMTPKGRNEDQIMDWVRRHDRYEGVPAPAGSCCHD